MCTYTIDSNWMSHAKMISISSRRIQEIYRKLFSDLRPAIRINIDGSFFFLFPNWTYVSTKHSTCRAIFVTNVMKFRKYLYLMLFLPCQNIGFNNTIIHECINISTDFPMKHIQISNMHEVHCTSYIHFRVWAFPKSILNGSHLLRLLLRWRFCSCCCWFRN